MTKRATMKDIARTAGVGPATVDRVLNARAPVRGATAQRVMEAAEELGYHAAPLIRRRAEAKLPQRRFGFVLQKRHDQFYQSLGDGLKSQTVVSPLIRGDAIVAYVDELVPHQIVSAMLDMAPRVDALACVAVDHPLVSKTIEDLAAGDIPAFALLSTLSAGALAGYIGLDNRKAGRTAAWIMAHAAGNPGSVAVMVGSHRYVGQELSEIGFRSFFRERPGDLTLLDTSINLDAADVAYGVTLDLLRKHDDLTGIYDAGGGRDGIIRALREEGNDRNISVICNELTPVTRAALIDDIITCVLSLPIEAFSAAVIEEMARSATDGTRANHPVQRILPFNIYFSENLAS